MAVSTLIPKVSAEPKIAVPQSDNAQEAVKGESAAPPPVTGATVSLSQTEQANRAFLNAVQNIPGVLAAKLYGGKTLAEQSIVVVIPAMQSSTSGQVFELEGEVFRAYPDARLDVRVIGLQERGLDVSQLETVLPQ